MSIPRFVQLFLFLLSFSLVFVVFWCLGVKFSLNSENWTNLRRSLNPSEDQLPSPIGQSWFSYGTLSELANVYVASNEDLEDLDATKSSIRYTKLQNRQYSRRKLIHDWCSQNITLGIHQTLDDIPYNQLTNLIVDDMHGIIYCYVPKVACTEWKSIMIFLSESLKLNGVPYKNHSDIPRDAIHSNSVIRLNRSRRSLMKWKIQKYKKFLFVRNPFVRLISAYRDKFEKNNDYFYKLLAVPIMMKYKKFFPPESAEHAHMAGIRPSFSDFIQYILDLPDYQGIYYEEHWRQMYHLCHPCQIEYDFIGKMETMDEDAHHLLRFLKVDHLVHFPTSTSNRTEESWIKTWFTDIPVEWRKQLYKIYEQDFKLFGYSLPENIFENVAT